MDLLIRLFSGLSRNTFAEILLVVGVILFALAITDRVLGISVGPIKFHPSNADSLLSPRRISPRILMGCTAVVMVVMSFGIGYYSGDPIPLFGANAVPTSGHIQSAYTADWSRWNLSSGQWKVSDHQQTIDGIPVKNSLISDGSSPCCVPSSIDLIAPFEPSTDDYSVEARIQEIGLNADADAQHLYFGLLVRADDRSNGYLLGIFNDGSSSSMGASFLSIIGPDPGATQFIPGEAIDMGSGSHVLRVELVSAEIKFYVDGKLLISKEDVTFLKGGHVGLVDSGYQLTVSRFTVST